MGEPGKFEMETHHQIHNNRTGDCIKVGPDRDGLGLIEIRSDDQDILLTIEQAALVAEALGVQVQEFHRKS